MLRNYILITLRNFKRQKFHAALNIAGLAIGLSCAMLIGLYIKDELTFDQFHRNHENIYQVGMHVNFGGQEFQTASSCPVLAGEMMLNIPGIDAVTRINPWNVRNIVMRHAETTFTEHKAFVADSNFFQFFTFDLLEGDPVTALKEAHSLVITPAVAKRYFGNTSAMGKLMTVGNKNETYTVTGIASPPPGNSQIQYEILISSASDRSMQHLDWGNNDGVYTYIKINPSASIQHIGAALREVTKKNIAPLLEEAFGVPMAEFEKQGGIYAFKPFSMTAAHLYHPEITDGPTPPGDIQYVYMIGAVGLFILLIACINFMNLATARSALRAKEIGLRKTFGSIQSKLMSQFFTESFVYVCIAAIISMGMVALALPSFNLLSGKEMSLNDFANPVLILGVIVTIIIVTLFAGSYPAFYLSAFKPIAVLKGKIISSKGSGQFRKVLVSVQFFISILLIISTLVVFQQLRYMQERNIGMDRQHVLTLQNTNRLRTHQLAFRNAVNNIPGVVNSSYCSEPFPELNRAGVIRAEGTTRDIVMQMYATDAAHIDVTKIQILQGRFFVDNNNSDSMACIINEAALREFGWQDPLQHKLTFDASGDPGIHIVGVVKDFNFESFKSKIKPLVIRYRQKSDYLHIRYEGPPDKIVKAVEKQWKAYAAETPFEYTFLDQDFDHLFKEELRLGKLFAVLTVIAIIVACLGLLGLASFTAEQRTVEIGIRKVLGASISAIFILLTRELTLIISVAFSLACFAAWYCMQAWLETFAFRTALNPLVFALSGMAAAIIAWITVSYHFIKAAAANPCDSIKDVR